ncbi:MAG: hypothetical protein AAGA23_15675 [Pseudomonadota bacterium]
MTTEMTNNLLQTCVDAARSDTPQAAVDQAARRFRERLPSPRPASRLAGSLRWAGAALALVACVGLVPLLVPGNGVAFASVQEWFRSFETVRMHMTFESEGAIVTEVRVMAEASGFARVETGPVTHIVDPESATMTTLLPGDQAMRIAIPDNTGWDSAVDAGAMDSEALAWFAELRDFQGRAEPLDETRTIDGLLCRGYRLELDATRVTLWADVDTNQPVRLEASVGDGMLLEISYTFNEPLPAELFEVPEGVTIVVELE